MFLYIPNASKNCLQESTILQEPARKCLEGGGAVGEPGRLGDPKQLLQLIRPGTGCQHDAGHVPRHAREQPARAAAAGNHTVITPDGSPAAVDSQHDSNANSHAQQHHSIAEGAKGEGPNGPRGF